MSLSSCSNEFPLSKGFPASYAWRRMAEEATRTSWLVVWCSARAVLNLLIIEIAFMPRHRPKLSCIFASIFRVVLLRVRLRGRKASTFKNNQGYAREIIYYTMLFMH